MNLLRNDFMEQIAFEYKTEVTIYSPEFIFSELYAEIFGSFSVWVF